MTAGGREDGGRENVQKEQQGAEEEDEGQTPVDGELQRGHVALSGAVQKVSGSPRPPSHLKREQLAPHRILCTRLGGRTHTEPRILSVLSFERLLSALFYTLETH